MDPILPFATLLVAFLSSILSGIAGSGGSFIMAPYWLVIGLTPAQGAASGAFMALGLGGGSLAAFKGSSHVPKDKRVIIGLLIITALTSVIGPFFLNRINTETFAPILALITILSLPLLFISRSSIKVGRHSRLFGWIFLTLTLLASSFITSSAFSIVLAVLLLQVFELSVLQSTVIRRMIGLIQSLVIFIVLASLGNFIWQHALAGLVGGIAGSYIGTKIAIKQGEVFAKWALAIGALTGIAALLV
jgi:uncharacterized protein